MGYTPPWLNLISGTGKWTMYPPGAGTDDFYIYPNATDVRPAIIMYGAGNFDIYTTAAYPVRIYDNTTQALTLTYESANSHYKILSVIDAKDLYLATTGTGVLKFGTYTAGAATDSTGYITIKDAAGNTRKLMVQA